MADRPLLSVSGLRTVFRLADGREAAAVDDVSFELRRGETLGLVGESGSGKSVTALSLIGLVSPPGRVAGGRIELDGVDLRTLDDARMRAVRGRRIGFVFQEPMVALDPVYTIGAQIEETLAVHDLARGRQGRRRTLELLEAVRIPDPERRAREYPHQLSGGLRQRAMMALALAADPVMLIADEPTTALDVTVQAEILDLLRDLGRRLSLALLLITHDLGVVAEMADRVAVMYAGRIVEVGDVRTVFTSPAHPYTQGLFGSIPGAGGEAGPPAGGEGDLGPAAGAAAAAATGRPARLRAIQGSVPPLGQWPQGCAFHPRCPARFEPCQMPPDLYRTASGQLARCFLHDPSRA